MVFDHAILYFKRCDGIGDENTRMNELYIKATQLQKDLLELEKGMMQYTEQLWERERVGR